MAHTESVDLTKPVVTKPTTSGHVGEPPAKKIHNVALSRLERS